MRAISLSFFGGFTAPGGKNAYGILLSARISRFIQKNQIQAQYNLP